MDKEVKTLLSFRKKVVGNSTRTLLNLLTGWVCIGFCQSNDTESQLNCDTICGVGRATQPKKLKE